MLVSLFLAAWGPSGILPVSCGTAGTLLFPVEKSRLPCLLLHRFLSAMTDSALSNF